MKSSAKLALVVALSASSMGVAACHPSVVDDAHSSGGDGAGGIDGPGGPFEVCGGSDGIVCADDLYCAFKGGSCGEQDIGVCTSLPARCDKGKGERVCGCDGKFYANACEAKSAGVGVTSADHCMFRCSADGMSVLCERGNEYCWVNNTGGYPFDPKCFPARPKCECGPADPECTPEFLSSPECYGDSCELKNGEVFCYYSEG